MTDKNVFEAIMTLAIKEETGMMMDTLSSVMKYGTVTLNADANGQVYYQAPIAMILENDIPNEDIYKIRYNGWEINGDFIIKRL